MSPEEPVTTSVFVMEGRAAAGSQGLEAVLHQGAHPGQGVAEHRHLLSLLERARMVRDRYLDRPVALPHELDQELPVEVEPVAFEREPGDAVPAEDLVHGERVV